MIETWSHLFQSRTYDIDRKIKYVNTFGIFFDNCYVI